MRLGQGAAAMLAGARVLFTIAANCSWTSAARHRPGRWASHWDRRPERMRRALQTTLAGRGISPRARRGGRRRGPG